MSSTDITSLTEEDRRQLLQVARDSIVHGLQHGRPLPVNIADYHPDLLAQRACFVTLNMNGDLRGCIGHLEAMQPLVVDVAENAYAAAFRDPRFPPLRAEEWPRVELHISVLTPPEPMHFDSEADLLSQLQPGVDGLILSDGRHRGTFLPSVWDSLRAPADFLRHLKAKAGLAFDHWSDTVQAQRYRTESFGDD